MSWVERRYENNRSFDTGHENQQWLESLKVGDVVARTVHINAITARGWGKAHLYTKPFELHVVVTRILQTQIICDKDLRYAKKGCSAGFGVSNTRGAIHKVTRKDQTEAARDYHEKLNNLMNQAALLSKMEFSPLNCATVDQLELAVAEMEGHQIRMRGILAKSAKE
ncbi:hypothetical protein [Vibrio phage V-YDF132]|nr:hypothetical protein [Vibrio phage V-YDF132]